MATNTAAPARDGAAPRWPRIVVLIVAVLELLTGLGDVPILFGDLSDVPGPGLAGAVIIAKVALQPILALAALVLAMRGNLTDAMLMLAAIIALTWLTSLPSVADNGLGLLGESVVEVFIVFDILVVPAIALALAVLALARRFRAAALLVALPQIVRMAGVIAFAISVSIYGF